MKDALYFSYNRIHEILAGLASRIKKDGCIFDYIIAIGAGGYVPSRILKTYLNYPILSVTVTSYEDETGLKSSFFDQRVIQWLENTRDCVKGKRILLVDEVDDTRDTISFCTHKLLNENNVESLTVAVLHNKKKEKIAALPECVNYYAGDEIDDYWVIYPWEASDIREHIKKC